MIHSISHSGASTIGLSEMTSYCLPDVGCHEPGLTTYSLLTRTEKFLSLTYGCVILPIPILAAVCLKYRWPLPGEERTQKVSGNGLPVSALIRPGRFWSSSSRNQKPPISPLATEPAFESGYCLSHMSIKSGSTVARVCHDERNASFVFPRNGTVGIPRAARGNAISR